MSDITLLNELIHIAKLDPKHRGELAELAFMRKAASLGFAVAKPWGDSDRYDVILRVNKTFLRIQVKSVRGKRASRHDYRVVTADSRKHRYNADQIEFLVAYIFPEDTWYVFPPHVIENRLTVSVRPGSKKDQFAAYHEAWHLIRSAAEPNPPVPDCSACAYAKADSQGAAAVVGT